MFGTVLIFSMTYLENPIFSSQRLEKVSWEKCRSQIRAEEEILSGKLTARNHWRPVWSGWALEAGNAMVSPLLTNNNTNIVVVIQKT